MLDRLPVELLSHILRLAAPLEYTPDKYRERRELLRRLCLVCKRVMDVAQPMLPQVFTFQREADEAHLREGDPARGQSVRLLKLHEHYRESCPVEATLGACRNVVDLRLSFLMDFNLGLLADLKNLRHLTTMYTNPTCPPNLVLPNLVSAALAGRAVQTPFFETFLTSTRLPSLRSLSIELSSGDSRLYGTRKLPSFPLSLLRQLDDLIVGASDIPLADLSTLEPAPVLVDCHWMELYALCSDPSPLPPALRLYDIEYLASSSESHLGAHDSFAVFQVLNTFRIRLFSMPLPSKQPRVLVLPGALQAKHRPLHHLVETAVKELLDACGKIEVEVLWDSPSNRQIEPRLSSVFREWVLRDRWQRKEVEQTQSA
ncbi:hypothetical protein JCM6882_000507 [Rhodosporidiobolus microsporus]